MAGTPSTNGGYHQRIRLRAPRVAGGWSGTSVERLEDRCLLSVAVPTPPPNVASGGHAVVVPAAVAPVLAAVPSAIVNVGKTFTYQLAATGVPAPTFSLASAPSGMTVNKTTGLISWTPTVRQVGIEGATAKATNSAGSSSRSFRIVVTNWIAPAITAPAGLSATVGGTFTYQMVATGTPAPSFSLVSAPAGMTISDTGLITWSPASLGTQSVTVSASNIAGSTTSTFAVTAVPDTFAPTAPVVTVGPITAVDALPLSWTGSTDDVGVVGYRIYTFTPAVYRGHSGRGGGYVLVTPAKYTLLVDNVTSTSYTITGLAPDSTHQYAVAAFDAAGNQSPYSVVVSGTTLLPPSFTWSSYGVTDPVLSAVADYPLTFYFSTTGNPSPTLSMISAPAGVTYFPEVITNSQLTMVTAHITWTPTADEVGVNYITMQATNLVGTYTYSIPITVTPDTPQLSVSLNGGITYGAGQFAAGQSNYQVTANPGFGGAANPQYGLSGTPFNFQVTSASNAGPTTFSLVSGPDGMTLDPITGAGTWTPTKDQAGSTSVTIAAINGAGTSTLEITFPTYFTGAPGMPAATYVTSVSGTLSPNPTMTWAAPADTTGIAGYLLTVTDAHTNATTTFDTLSTDTSYTLSGLGGQQYFVTVTPYDASGNPGQTSPTVSIYALAMPVLAWTVSPANATVGTPLSVQFSPNSWVAYSIVSGPAGAMIDPNTGLLTWTPTDAGNATIVVAGASANGWGTVEAILNIVVS